MKKLLIVDDEPDLLYLMEQTAKSRHFSCERDDTGAECLEKANNFQPDLILLDMNLPKISGLGILRELKNQTNLSTIPVVILSAIDQKDVIDEAIELGAKAYFVKNGNMEELFTTIDGLIEQEKLHF